MECLLEINFRSFQDNIRFDSILDRIWDHFRDDFRSILGSRTGFEQDFKSLSTSVRFSTRFWIRFGRLFASNLATFSAHVEVPCGMLPCSLLIQLHFLDFCASKAFLGPSWTGFRTIFGSLLGGFRAQKGIFDSRCIVSRAIFRFVKSHQPSGLRVV